MHRQCVRVTQGRWPFVPRGRCILWFGSEMNDVHFRNFLGVPGSALCNEEHVAVDMLTLSPTAVTCPRCLALLGRLRTGNFAPPSEKKERKE